MANGGLAGATPHPASPSRGEELERCVPHAAAHKVSSEDYARAKRLRREMSLPEKLLWHKLRSLPKDVGLAFRRQQPIHPYVVDFACLRLRMVIEVDGWSHDQRLERDRQRDLYLARLGYVTLRFTNDDVTGNLDGVVETIVREALARR